MCVFCEIAGGERDAHFVLENEVSLGFLDVRPLFPGHSLLIPRAHHETLADLPEALVEPYFLTVKALAEAVRSAMEAVGTFVAINNKISQSVPHLHTHVVPRNPKDGLRGFFWPRTKYASDEEMAATAALIREAVERDG